ncbi:hypothetical protein [Nocardioides sp. R-C-SC26]|uniref:hypothetical protein n=1 Tax=Nocardioides sp. R-C-SC26 TaxID=2870414 RepID=UPI001E53ADD2|nr:hypothetical protein [Nocardioides sp. R-C-SC26]
MSEPVGGVAGDPPSEGSSREAVCAAEAWFVHHGLPYFVDDVRALVAARLSRPRVLAVLTTAVLLGAVAGVGLAVLTEPSYGLPAGASVAGVVVGLYALRALRSSVIAAWALRRGFASLDLLLPLATRALPMLLLFITFLFINAEVWQVASALQGGVLWAAVMFFAAAALGFMVPRMAQELDRFDDGVDVDDVLAGAAGTPLEDAAREVVDAGIDLPERAQVTGLQMVNLVGVLVIAQALQVLLLSLAVFLFFLVFGAVAIDDAVITSWVGAESGAPHPLWGLDSLSAAMGVSVELVHVAVFLAAFSGLHFTVVAITDEVYRREFFTDIMAELARAVGMRVVYQELQRRRAETA